MRDWLAFGTAAAAACVLGLALVGCGDDDSGDTAAACESFKACGGDVVGSWSLDGMCLAGIEDLLDNVADTKGCENFFRGSRLRPEGTSGQPLRPGLPWRLHRLFVD